MPKNNLPKTSLTTLAGEGKPIDFSVVKKVDFTTAIIDVTYKCNDNCIFCFNKKFINKAPELSLSEIKQRFAHACRRWFVSQVILTGGEPTLHSQFWEIMDFFCNHAQALISLNTNGILLQEKHFSTKLIKLLKEAKNKRKTFSLSLSNVDHFPPQSKKEKLKIRGVQESIRIAHASDTSVVVVISITKSNYRILPKLTRLLLKTSPKRKILISIRGLYVDNSMTEKQKQATIPRDFQTIQPYILAALKEIVRYQNAKIRLFNLPLCYFRTWENLPKIIDQQEPWWHERRIKIRKGAKNEARFFKEQNWARPECSRCALESICGKIQSEYLTKYNYPPLTPF